MIYTITAIFDVAVGAFNRPMFTRSTGEAVRLFTDETNREAPDNPLYNHPEDYRLFNLGTYSDEDGSFNTPPKPELILDATQAALKR